MSFIRTTALAALLAATGFAALPLSGAAGEGKDIGVEVYMTPTCGCCGAWVEHLRDNGFEVTTHTRNDLSAIKREAGLTPELASCHTARVEGYAIEGHVPADDIRRLLEEKPAARGLTVPGMPMGSPGMEGPYRDSYDTLLYREDGRTRVFQHHPGDG